MDASPDAREETFLLWASMGFNYEAYQANFYRDTHWGDKAYQVSSDPYRQSNYDFI